MFLTLRCRVFADATGAYTEVPAILTPAGWLMPLLDYCLAHSHDRSVQWMVKQNHAVRLFLAYMMANPNERDPRRLFSNFAQRLYTGTFDRETGLDPSWLCWRPRSPKEVRKIIVWLSEWFEWLGAQRPDFKEVNPHYAGTAYDRMFDEAAYQWRREKAFLGHTWNATQPAETRGRLIRAPRPPKVEHSNPPAFPEDRLLDLLQDGFRVGNRLNYRDICIALLLHGAGFRMSEPFHLYIQDVVPDPANPKQALVRIYHPSHGMAPKDWRDERGKSIQGNRAAYLGEVWGLAPRTHLLDSRHAGWKGGMHEEEVGEGYFLRAYWFQPQFGELFLSCWNRYLEQIAGLKRPHPFAFCALSEPGGQMYTIAHFVKAHARACERIGLTAAKALGTTPHGHRHAYGRRLVAGGFSQDLIRRFMHHTNLESQGVYTTPTPAQVMENIKIGLEKMNAGLNAIALA